MQHALYPCFGLLLEVGSGNVFNLIILLLCGSFTLVVRFSHLSPPLLPSLESASSSLHSNDFQLALPHLLFSSLFSFFLSLCQPLTSLTTLEFVCESSWRLTSGLHERESRRNEAKEEERKREGGRGNRTKGEEETRDGRGGGFEEDVSVIIAITTSSFGWRYSMKIMMMMIIVSVGSGLAISEEEERKRRAGTEKEYMMQSKEREREKRNKRKNFFPSFVSSSSFLLLPRFLALTAAKRASILEQLISCRERFFLYPRSRRREYEVKERKAASPTSNGYTVWMAEMG